MQWALYELYVEILYGHIAKYLVREKDLFYSFMNLYTFLHLYNDIKWSRKLNDKLSLHNASDEILVKYFLLIVTVPIGSSRKLSKNLPLTVGGIVGAFVILVVGVIFLFILRYISTYCFYNNIHIFILNLICFMFNNQLIEYVSTQWITGN